MHLPRVQDSHRAVLLVVCALLLSAAPGTANAVVDGVSEVLLGRALSCVAVGPYDEVYGWEDHSLIVSYDYGDTWETVRTFPDSIDCRGLFVNSAGSTFLGLTRTGKLMVTHRGMPRVWDESLTYGCSDCTPNTNNSTMWKMCEDNRKRVYVGEYGGAWSDTCAFIHRSSDGGQTWTTVYEGAGRHVHFVRYDVWQNAIYAGIGDGEGRQRIIRSRSGGASWDTLSISGCMAQPTDMISTESHRIFGSDCGNDVNSIYRTADDETFETTLLLDGLRDAYVWDIGGDAESFIIAGTVARMETWSAVALYASLDGGATWVVLKKLGTLPEWSGATNISRMDSEGHTYYTSRDPMHDRRAYRLTIEALTDVAQDYETPRGTTISCTSPCSRSALVLIRSDRDIEHADVTVHNIAGRKVATLLSAPVHAGTTPIRWNTAGGSASSLPSGVYFVRMRSASEAVHAMFVLVR